MDLLDFEIEMIEGRSEGAWYVIVFGEQRGPIGPENPDVELGIEEGDFEAVAGGCVAVRLRDAVDQALESESPEIVGHLGGGIRPARERFDVGPEVAVVEASRQMGKAAEGLEDGHDARVPKAKGRHALSQCDRRLLESIQAVLREHAVVTDALDFQELAIDLLPEVAQVGEVGEAFPYPEVARIVDRELGA